MRKCHMCGKTLNPFKDELCPVCLILDDMSFRSENRKKNKLWLKNNPEDPSAGTDRCRSVLRGAK